MLSTVDETNAKTVRVSTEYNGSPALPTTFHWRLYCETSKRQVVELTEETPQTEYDDLGAILSHYVDVTVPASANVIQNDRNPKELKSLECITDYGLDTQRSVTQQYYVRNRSGR